MKKVEELPERGDHGSDDCCQISYFGCLCLTCRRDRANDADCHCSYYPKTYGCPVGECKRYVQDAPLPKKVTDNAQV